MMRIPAKYLIPLVVAYLLYASVFIYQTSFIVNGERYFSLFDDAMIAMRYARNLAEGHGLVWNPGGERVEGVTTPLWTTYMAFWHLVGLPESKISLAIQLTSAALLAINLVLVWTICTRLTGRLGLGAAAAILTAFFYPLNNWALQGMEVGLLALMVTFSVAAVIKSLDTGRVSASAYLVLALAVWVRIDAVVLYLAFLSFLLLRDRPHWKKHLLLGGSLLIVSLSLQTASRVWYFGDWLPNTYYLKMTGYPWAARVMTGFKILVRQAARMDAVLVLAVFFSPLVRRDHRSLLLIWVVMLQSAYSVYVGGDAWEEAFVVNRYIAVIMPLFFILLEDSVWLVGKQVVLSQRNRAIGLSGFLAVSLVLFNAYPGSGFKNFRSWLLMQPPFHVRENAHAAAIGLLLREITENDAKVAVTWGGATPYFSDRYCIDLLGKSDRHVARQPMHPIPEGFRPGHQKWDYPYSFGQLKPHVVAHLGSRDGTGPWESDARPFLANYSRLRSASSLSSELRSFPLHVRCGSPRIKWSLLPQLGLIPDPPCDRLAGN